MKVESLKNIHPGNILKEDYLTELFNGEVITVEKFADMMNLSVKYTQELLDGERDINVWTAMRLGKLFGQTPEMWLNLQNNYDVVCAKHNQNFMSLLDNLKPIELTKSVKEFNINYDFEEMTFDKIKLY